MTPTQEQLREFWPTVGAQKDSTGQWWVGKFSLLVCGVWLNPLSSAEVPLEVLIDLWRHNLDYEDFPRDTWTKWFGLSGQELREVLVTALMEVE